MTRNLVAARLIAVSVIVAAGCATSSPPPPHRGTTLSFGKGFPVFAGYYPADLALHHVEGTARLRICVSPNGELAGPPKIVESTGNSRLDAAAVRYAYATSGHWVMGGPKKTICPIFPLRFHEMTFGPY